MKIRYARSWAKHDPLGSALVASTGWQFAVPRVGNLFPGITTPIPKGELGDFREICLARAVELWSCHKVITVLWSGGVDSTLVAVLLAATRPSDGSLYVTLNSQSAVDGAGMLSAFKKLGIQSVTMDSKKGFFVTGYHADSILIGELYDTPTVQDKIWSMSIGQVIAEKMNISVRLAEEMIERLEPLISLMPLERTTANIAWWIDFSSFWDFDEYSAGYLLGVGTPGRDYTSFFSHDAFQVWAIQDTRLKTQGGYKALYRKIIEEISGVAPQTPKNSIGVALKSQLSNPNLLAIREDYSLVIGV